MDTQNKQQVQTYQQANFSEQLIQCLIKLDIPAKHSEAKIELISLSSELMPNGNANFLGVVKYPMIKMLIEQKGRKQMLAVLSLLVKDFCASMNVVRNMNKDQMIEAAAMLLDECDNFRLEDYTMMFQMAKRGELFDIHDRIDLQVITEISDAYWQKRHEAGEKIVNEETLHLETMGSQKRSSEYLNTQDEKLMSIGESFSASLSHLKGFVTDKIGTKEERQKLKEIEQRDREVIKKQLKERGY